MIEALNEPASAYSQGEDSVRQVRVQTIRPERLPFFAEVRATELDSGREVWGETANLSRGGCYVRTSESFCEGTLLQIEIRNKGTCFQTDARVVYAFTSEGMGLCFLNIPASELTILARWISSAEGAGLPNGR